MLLKDLAQAAGMTRQGPPLPGELRQAGLITQDGAAGRYGLGPLAMQIGLISLQQFDPIRLATAARLADLAQQLGQTVAIAVWGTTGRPSCTPTKRPLPVHVAMRHGAVMSLRGTASGRLFAAYLPRSVVRAAAERCASLRQGL
jgi:DNA-binding IclR family transcriptional regulator